MSEHERETCGATAQHPELDVIGCELPAGHKGAHRFTVAENDTVEWDDDSGEGEHGSRAGFDIEAFVKALPEGVCLCPMCLGMGGVVEEPPFDPTTHRCTVCDGRGRVRTGSTKSDEAERDCKACQGKGWMPNDPNEPPASPATAEHLADELPARDVAGRTPDDPDFDWTRVVDRQAAEPEPEPAPA